MNKDEEIIKLAQFLHNRYCNEDACCKDINECKICNCTSKALAEVLYNAGYRKVPDGAVILTPEERDEELKACNEKQAELEAEIDRLKADNEALQMWNEAYMKENEKLKEENHKLENDLAGFDEFARGISKTRIEITGEAIPTCKTLLEYIKKEKSNAVKEFSEKLKAKAHSVVGFNVRKKVYAKEYTINEIDIDEALKEFLK